MRGGPNSEYEVSLATGGSVLAALRGKLADKYRAYDILIDKSGRWHIDGMPADQYDIAHRFDVIFNALHGSYGEDGKVQQILEAHGIKFTGSDSLASAVGMNKNLSKNVFKNNGLKTPVGKEIDSSRIKESRKKWCMNYSAHFPCQLWSNPCQQDLRLAFLLSGLKPNWFRLCVKPPSTAIPFL